MEDGRCALTHTEIINILISHILSSFGAYPSVQRRYAYNVIHRARRLHSSISRGIHKADNSAERHQRGDDILFEWRDTTAAANLFVIQTIYALEKE